MGSNQRNEAPAGRTAMSNKKLSPGTWSVNLSDDETREMTTAQIVAGWKNGTVTSEAYVWKDGLADWMPLLEVPELRTKLGPAPRSTTGRTSGAVRPSHTRMNDMFGGLDVDDDAETAPAPRVASSAPVPKQDDKTLGARNESSVLFSLDALKGSLDDEDKGKPEEVDVFGLGGGGGSLGGLGAGDMMGGLGRLSSPLGSNTADLLTAPVQEPPKPRIHTLPNANRPGPAKNKKKGLLIAAVVGVLALGGAAFALVGAGDDSAELAAQEAAQAEEEAEKQRMAEQLAAAEAEKQKMAEQLAEAEAEKKRIAEEEEKKAEEARKKEEEEKAKAEAEEKAEAEKAAAAKVSTTTKAAPSPAAAPSGGGGAFNKDAARSALASAAARAASCKKPNGPTGPGKAVVTFSPSGNATNAVVQGGAYGGTPVGGCIASQFRKAKVPPFSGASVTVAKSFKL